jgi:tripartite-type tricarboxylate transporter receptor subunit TctC
VRNALRAAMAAAAMSCGPALAQDYPSRIVTIVNPTQAGATTDVLARALAVGLSSRLGQQFLVANRPGASGAIGTASVARAAPDGYTLLLANSGILAANAALYKRTGYDPVKDFTPITLVGAQANVLVVHPAVPAKSLAELIARAKMFPGKINYASGGVGSSPHLAAELLKKEAKINIAHVPYKGTGLAMKDLVAGYV